MSHFLTYVLLAGRTKDIEKEVRAKLADYDEDLDVDPYQKACWCVGHKARTEADEAISARVQQNRDEHRQQLGAALASEFDEPISFAERPAWLKRRDEIEEAIRPSWKDRIGPLLAERDRLAAESPEREAVDPGCDTCSGTGSYESTRNPKAKWDWYVVGGRWAGHLAPGYDWTKDPANKTVCYCCAGTGTRSDAIGREARAKDPTYTCNACRGTGKTLNIRGEASVPCGGNYRPVRDILAMAEDAEKRRSLRPFSIVTPDGEWHQKADMGWWGCTSNESDTWDDEAWGILRDHPAAVVVVCDLHI